MVCIVIACRCSQLYFTCAPILILIFYVFTPAPCLHVNAWSGGTTSVASLTIRGPAYKPTLLPKAVVVNYRNCFLFTKFLALTTLLSKIAVVVIVMYHLCVDSLSLQVSSF